jgi:hypothetical protein
MINDLKNWNYFNKIVFSIANFKRISFEILKY